LSDAIDGGKSTILLSCKKGHILYVHQKTYWDELVEVDEMGQISLVLNEQDDALIRKYAKLNNMDVSDFIRRAVIERIEEEHDLTLFNQVWGHEKNQERISHEDLKKE
jgi:hypothetical protein